MRQIGVLRRLSLNKVFLKPSIKEQMEQSETQKSSKLKMRELSNQNKKKNSMRKNLQTKVVFQISNFLIFENVAC